MFWEKLPPIKQEDIMPRMKRYSYRAGQMGHLGDMPPEIKHILHHIYQTGMKTTHAEAKCIYLSSGKINKKWIPPQLQDYSAFSIFFVTLGKAIDDRIDMFFKNRMPLEGTFLDAWGSESVEQLAKNIDSALRCRYERGSIRFSPGYSGFSILNNIHWIQLIQQLTQHISISVSPTTGILSPRKSILCMIGWEKDYIP